MSAPTGLTQAAIAVEGLGFRVNGRQIRTLGFEFTALGLGFDQLHRHPALKIVAEPTQAEFVEPQTLNPKP